MTPLESMAVDYVKARLAEKEIRDAYMSSVEQAQETQDYDNEELIRLSNEKMRARKLSIQTEAAMISHVKAAYEVELKD